MKSKLFVISAALILAGSLVLGLKLNQSSESGDGYVQEVSAQKLLEHVKGQASPLVLVNFWASWCEPCKVEFPHILQVRQKYADKGLKVVFVSIDDPSELVEAEKFLRQQKVDFPTFYKGKQPLKFVTEIYPSWSGAVPMSLLFGADGKIIEAWEGDTSLEEFEMRVQRNLKGT